MSGDNNRFIKTLYSSPRESTPIIISTPRNKLVNSKADEESDGEEKKEEIIFGDEEKSQHEPNIKSEQESLSEKDSQEKIESEPNNRIISKIIQEEKLKKGEPISQTSKNVFQSSSLKDGNNIVIKSLKVNIN